MKVVATVTSPSRRSESCEAKEKEYPHISSQLRSACMRDLVDQFGDAVKRGVRGNVGSQSRILLVGDDR
ncbi:hypothetical protein A5886_002601 [Enterococcus sp. 8G7_MSG3316]|uniref:Uncharacterized protein n=1 Tax=Candidatus Enterococcus testudinis TaxID=1834191 RepID=A0A242A9V2_9ENTE|nr:hypothetical protein A5886_002601 [Enterococcus sp. 8G7_MSG3316]